MDIPPPMSRNNLLLYNIHLGKHHRRIKHRRRSMTAFQIEEVPETTNKCESTNAPRKISANFESRKNGNNKDRSQIRTHSID